MSTHGSKLVSASEDGNARLWKLTSEGLECVQTFGGYFGFLRSVSFTPDAKFVVVGSGDDCDSDLRFWKIEDGACPQGQLEQTVPSQHSNRLTRRKQASHSGRQLDIHEISEPSYKEEGDSMGAEATPGFVHTSSSFDRSLYMGWCTRQIDRFSGNTRPVSCGLGFAGNHSLESKVDWYKFSSARTDPE